MYIVETKNLTKKYKDAVIVNSVNMHVKKGSIYGFIGENGAGKTTVLRLLISLIKESSGEIKLFSDANPKSRYLSYDKVGALIEQPTFYPNLSAYDTLKYYAIQKRCKYDSIPELLKTVGLHVDKNKKVKDYSLGMKQRLGIALALLGTPELLILDEPLNGLDPKGIIEMRKLMRSLNEEQNTTIIISSHMLSELECIATDYGVMHKGQLIKEFSMEDFYRHANSGVIFTVEDSAPVYLLLKKHLRNSAINIISNEQVRIENREEAIQAKEILKDNGINILQEKNIEIKLEDYFMELTSES